MSCARAWRLPRWLARYCEWSARPCDDARNNQAASVFKLQRGVDRAGEENDGCAQNCSNGDELAGGGGEIELEGPG